MGFFSGGVSWLWFLLLLFCSVGDRSQDLVHASRASPTELSSQPQILKDRSAKSKPFEFYSTIVQRSFFPQRLTQGNLTVVIRSRFGEVVNSSLDPFWLRMAHSLCVWCRLRVGSTLLLLQWLPASQHIPAGKGVGRVPVCDGATVQMATIHSPRLRCHCYFSPRVCFQKD